MDSNLFTFCWIWILNRVILFVVYCSTKILLGSHSICDTMMKSEELTENHKWILYSSHVKCSLWTERYCEIYSQSTVIFFVLDAITNRLKSQYQIAWLICIKNLPTSCKGSVKIIVYSLFTYRNKRLLVYILLTSC